MGLRFHLSIPQIRSLRRPGAWDLPVCPKKELALVAHSWSKDTSCLSGTLLGVGTTEAKVGVSKPEPLPKEFSPIVDVAGFLSAGQENRLPQEIADLEKETGFKLRTLAQNYPETPGLAIRDFWQVDDIKNCLCC